MTDEQFVKFDPFNPQINIGGNTECCDRASVSHHVLSRWQYDSTFHICRLIFYVSQLVLISQMSA